MPDRKEMSAEMASREAKKTGSFVNFQEFNEYRKLMSYGTAYSCGCIRHSTVLSDGSIGWGDWIEECPEHWE